MISSHRLSWKIKNGDIPKINGADWRGTCVCHTCDNPSCVNPDHLFIGTHKDNMEDRVRKNRQTIMAGSKNGKARLTDKDVRLARYWYSLGNMTQDRIRNFFGISSGCISNLLSGKSYRTVV